MDFGKALVALRCGERVARAGWNADGQWVALGQWAALLPTPGDHSKMRGEHLYMRQADGDLVSWTPTQSDVLADDWSVF